MLSRLAAIYFFAVQAFGLAVGGYLAGRLMGPVLETESEELFHATTHGLVVWGVAVVATATMVTLSSLVVTSSAINAAALFGAAEETNSVHGKFGLQFKRLLGRYAVPAGWTGDQHRGDTGGCGFAGAG